MTSHSVQQDLGCCALVLGAGQLRLFPTCCLPLDDIKICFHNNADRCTCRKPLPGLILDAAAEHGIDLAASYMVGDRWRDIKAEQAAGCHAIFIDYGFQQDEAIEPEAIVKSLAEAASYILSRA
jgi:D-glycero-D-manno-heptose 1,7-bisphosphate phosphatase